MNKIKFFFLAAAAALAAACDNSAIVPETGEGTMQINFNLPSATRAATFGHEADLNSVQMLVFDGGGSLYKYHDFTASEISAKRATLDKVVTGSYSVYVVANGPELSAVKTLSELKSTDIPLIQFNDTEDGFVMEGHNDMVNVTSGNTASPSISLSRYASRITLSRITNGLPAALGALKVERVFLSNVVNTQNIAGTKTPGSNAANWFNKEGRKDESTRAASHIIDGSTYAASAPGLTFAAAGNSIANGGNWSAGKLFYTYPNQATTKPNGFNATFAEQRTVLTIVASYSSKTYYYPVVLTTAPMRNYNYDVDVTITGIGSDDPVKPLDAGSIKAVITVEEWHDGTSYTETF